MRKKLILQTIKHYIVYDAILRETPSDKRDATFLELVCRFHLTFANNISPSGILATLSTLVQSGRTGRQYPHHNLLSIHLKYNLEKIADIFN